MGMDFNANIIAGLPESEIISVTISRKKVKKYNANTGKPYTKEVKHKIVLVGSTKIGEDDDDVFSFLEDRLDFCGSYWDSYEDEDENKDTHCDKTRVWGKALALDSNGKFDIPMLEELLKDAKEAFSNLGIKANPRLYLIAETTD